MDIGGSWDMCQDHAAYQLSSRAMTYVGLKILIVEDQFLIAKQVEMIVTAAGHRVVGIAGTLSDACRIAMSEEPHLAFVDLSLADGQTGTAVGSFIKDACKTEVVYTTANLRRLPDDFAGALGVVEKPFTKGDLLAALAYIVAIVTKSLIPAQVPSSLKLSPCVRYNADGFHVGKTARGFTV